MSTAFAVMIYTCLAIPMVLIVAWFGLFLWTRRSKVGMLWLLVMAMTVMFVLLAAVQTAVAWSFADAKASAFQYWAPVVKASILYAILLGMLLLIVDRILRRHSVYVVNDGQAVIDSLLLTGPGVRLELIDVKPGSKIARDFKLASDGPIDLSVTLAGDTQTQRLTDAALQGYGDHYVLTITSDQVLVDRVRG
jgi:hypothetical protein